MNTDEIKIDVYYGWMTMERIQRQLPDGRIELGHIVRDFDREGKLRSEKEVIGGYMVYE